MIKNTASGAALTTFLVVVLLAGELSFLALYKVGLFHRYGLVIGGIVLLLFLRLRALYYGIARWLFLRDAGRMTPIDRQFGAAEGLHEDLRTHIAAIRR
jgi:hypothetical protein